MLEMFNIFSCDHLSILRIATWQIYMNDISTILIKRIFFFEETILCDFINNLLFSLFK